MYEYRKMNEEERAEIVEYRRARRLPWHSPPHPDLGISDQYLITGTCYEHVPVVGKTPERMTQCEADMLAVCQEFGEAVYAWCVLPNHYHVLVKTKALQRLVHELGQFHGRCSHEWNVEDGQQGRQVWFRCFDRAMRSERHFWATVNYIHNNPVHHGYAEKWQDWPWSSAQDFLNNVGRERALEIWRQYPVLDYGKKWDP